MRKIIILVFFILLAISLVSANQTTECVHKLEFLERIKDNCTVENGICDDGEYPFKHTDCELTTEAVSCKERCIFGEMWFAKLALISVLLLLLKNKKDNFIWILLLILILVVNFSDVGLNIPERIEGNNPIQGSGYTPEEIEENIFLNIGSKAMPSNPLIGFFIIAGGALLIFKASYGKASRTVNKFRKINKRK